MKWSCRLALLVVLLPVPLLRAQAPPAAPAAPTASGFPDTGPGGRPPTSTGESYIGTRPTVESPGPEEAPLGPTPLAKVGLLQGWLFGDDKNAPVNVSGWLDTDYTYRSTGRGRNLVAPVMNRFGDEFLAREIGLWVYKPLDPKCWSWGFNALFLGGSDATFLTPTAGGWKNTNPRFGTVFTDLNLTAHLPILTEGGVDIKAGRQTTILGPMGALSWQRIFNSSDYAWYNLEEGRYTGVSAVWHVNKQLDLYNGIEIGGWGVFFDNPSRNVNYIGNISYWLDAEAKTTKVWTTVLTGPTGFIKHSGNTTTFEAGLLHNYNRYLYQIIDTQMTWSKAPLFRDVSPNYNQRAYDVYTYFGIHLDPCLDLNSRLEWYKDVDGGFYPGGFGVPHTSYYEVTIGFDYHPYSWMQFRPEIRYDHASHRNFGRNNDRQDQLSISADLLLKF